MPQVSPMKWTFISMMPHMLLIMVSNMNNKPMKKSNLMKMNKTNKWKW